MSTFVGMDVAQVDQLAKDLRAQAEQVDQISSKIDDLIRRMASIWLGQDAQRFADWWSSQHRPALKSAHDAIEGLAQSAKNNAEDQTRASGRSGGDVSGGAVRNDSLGPPSLASAPLASGSSAPAGQVGGSSGSLPGSNRSWQEVSAAYEANTAGVPTYYQAWNVENGGYQCTAWAIYRWRELGFAGDFGLGPDGRMGNGGQMAANNGGTTTTPPTLGAMASYGSGYGHVMIVEEVGDGGDRVRVSEMNAGDSQLAGHPNEYRSDNVLVRQENGTWAYQNGGRNVGTMTFASLPR